MEEKRCPETGCEGALIREENMNEWVNIYICPECHNRYKNIGGEFKKIEGRVIHMECAVC